VRAPAAEAREIVALALELEAPGENGWRPFRLALEVAPGWHVHANPASIEGMVATRVEGVGCALRRLSYPEGVRLELGLAEGPLRAYQGEAVITGELRCEGTEPKLQVSFQPCDERRCLPEASREVAVSPRAAESDDPT
jgi:hypothetical protein